MASTNTSSNRPWNATGGFTLVEASMGAAIGAFIMAGVLSTYIMSVRAFNAIGNYWEIHTDGRYAIDRFGADMRCASDITSFSSNGPLVVTIPTAFDGYGNIISNKSITYTYTASMLKRYDPTLGTTKVLATNVYNLKFGMYDRVGSNTTVLSNSKGMTVEIFLRKYTAGKKQTEDYLSARLNMRNKP